MSSITLDIFACPKEDITPIKAQALLKNLSEKNFNTIRNEHLDFFEEDLDFHFDGRVEFHELAKNTIFISLETRTSFPHRKFLKYVSSLENVDLEASVFHDQVGEYEYFKGQDFVESYGDVLWKWLTDPEPVDFEDKRVVVTGKFQDATRDEIEETIEDWGGIIQKSVNSKTDLLVVGDKPGASKTKKAKEFGVKQIDEDDFYLAIGEA